MPAHSPASPAPLGTPSPPSITIVLTRSTATLLSARLATHLLPTPPAKHVRQGSSSSQGSVWPALRVVSPASTMHVSPAVPGTSWPGLWRTARPVAVTASPALRRRIARPA